MSELDVTLAQPWAILPSALPIVTSALQKHMAGETVAVQPNAGRGQMQTGVIAVIPIHGMITQRGGGIFEMLFGGTSAEAIGANLALAVGSKDVRGIILDIDSPGGTVGGVAELADQVHAARQQKPIVAISNTLMASAAYWIGSQADRIIATPSSQTGSIGVYAVHLDYSKALEADGITPTIISAGKYKTEANEYSPLTEEAKAAWQGQIDAYYDLFVGAVARGRGRSAKTVRDGFGEGRVLTAEAAVAEHLADEVGTMDRAVAMVTGMASRRASAMAAALRLNLS